jgi:uncharacterized membrane protein
VQRRLLARCLAWAAVTASSLCCVAAILVAADLGWIGWGVGVVLGLAAGLLAYIVAPLSCLVSVAYLVVALVKRHEHREAADS